MKTKQCALMGCDLHKNRDMSLGWIIKNIKEDSIRKQAKELISKHGFKGEDIVCEDCFWK